MLLASEHLLTLTGPGGVGKTRLAHELIAREAAGYRVTAVVELAPVADGSSIEATVAAALSIGDPVTTEAVAGALAGGLLVLDNCEHLLADAAAYVRVLLAASPTARIVATSRQALGVEGERVHAVQTLDVPDAVAMLGERAATAVRGFTVDASNLDDITRICRRLDGIPLALELTAPRLRILRPRELAALLDARSAILDAARGSQRRQRTLRATIAWSYELLDPEARSVFHAVATFANPWSLEAATAVYAPDDPVRTRNAVNGLVERSLATAASNGENQRLLEPIREFALDVTPSVERTLYRTRHAAYINTLAAMVHTKAQPQGLYLNNIENSIDDVRAALQWTILGEGDRLEGVRLACNLTRFWIARLGHAAEGVRWLERAIERSRDTAGAALSAEAYHALSRLLVRRSRYGDAAAAALQALRLARAAGDETVAARILNTLGVMSAVRGQYVRARVFHSAHLAHARRAGDRHRVALTLADLGALEIGTSDRRRGIAYLDEAIGLFRAEGKFEDAHNLALALLYRGAATHLEGDSADALGWFDEAVKLADASQNKSLRSAVLSEQGAVFAAMGDVANARRVLVQAICDANEVNYRTTLPRAYDLLAEVVAFEGRSRDAAVILGAGEAMRRDLGIVRTPDDAAAVERVRSALLDRIGEPACAAAARRGRGLTVDAVLALAAARASDSIEG